MSNLSDLITLVNQVLDTTTKTITIPDNVISMEIIPDDVPVYLGMTSAACNLATNDHAKLITGTSEKIYSADLANRIFYMTSLLTGTCSIIYHKTLNEY